MMLVYMRGQCTPDCVLARTVQSGDACTVAICCQMYMMHCLPYMLLANDIVLLLPLRQNAFT
jgi:hypothetical protein